nr:hypothetical protein [Bacteroidota bacterium]
MKIVQSDNFEFAIVKNERIEININKGLQLKFHSQLQENDSIKAKHLVDTGFEKTMTLLRTKGVLI